MKMKNLLLLMLISSSLTYAQYQPMSIYRNIPVGDTCSIRVIPPDCYYDSLKIGGFITGGQRPIFYTWKYVSNNTIAQDSTLCTIVPGQDYLFDWLDHLDVGLNVPQPRLSNSLNWMGYWRLTAIDSRVESATDKHDTLIVNIKYKFPDQIILPDPAASVPSCDTCIGEYLWITPQRGTPPYNILLIGQDNLGNDVEYYGQQCNSLNITNLAQLVAGCYDIYIEDKMGCQEVFNYCFTTTGIDELSNNKELLRIVDMMGNPTDATPNKILFYQYTDGTTKKVLITQK
jgi:hypothetical protein